MDGSDDDFDPFMGEGWSESREKSLADRLLRASCERVVSTYVPCWCLTMDRRRILSMVSDEWFEKSHNDGRTGVSFLQAWPDVFIATFIERTQKKRVVEVIQRMAQGTLEWPQKFLQQLQGGTVLNTAFIERLNVTMRGRLANLTRQCLHAAHSLDALEMGMCLVEFTYKFCSSYHELSHTEHFGSPCTAAMASGLTDHIWSMWEV